MGIEDVFKTATSYLAAGVEASASLIIAIAAIQATIRALLLFFRRSSGQLNTQEPQTENIRLRLAAGWRWRWNLSWRLIFYVPPSRPRGQKLDSLRPSPPYEQHSTTSCNRKSTGQCRDNMKPQHLCLPRRQQRQSGARW